MRKKFVLIATIICMVLLSTIQNPSLVKSADKISANAVAAPSGTFTGTLGGAPYRIRVPQSWNGTLIVYAHGYRDRADRPGQSQTENREAHAAPGVDFNEGNSQEYEDYFLARGYALAGSAYTHNGWGVSDGVRNTRDLTAFFNIFIGRPKRTILWGFSMGSIITINSIEKYPFLYDGAICGCTIGAGSKLIWDNALDVGLSYDVAFGWPASWGTPANIRDDIFFDAEVFPVVLNNLQNPANFGKFEFIRLVNQIPFENFYSSDLPYLFVAMYYITEARAELETQYGGPVSQNENHNYKLSDADKTYLSSLGINANTLLATMNSRTNIKANPISRKLLEITDQFSGRIERPLINIHNIGDQLVRVSNVSVLRETIQSAGRSSKFKETYVASPGHCNFTKEQLESTINGMNFWLNTGVKPGNSFFPSSLLFDNAYQPPAWPQPTEGSHGN